MGASVPIALRVLGGFELKVGGRVVELPLQSQRLVGLLAVHGDWLHRTTVAGQLWADSSAMSASTKLRNALWRVRRVSAQAIAVHRDLLALGPGVDLDLNRAQDWAARLRHDKNLTGAPSLDLFTRDLLPDWDEDWLVMERESLRQLRMHALERMSLRWRREGRYADAVEAALAAVIIEPLRETAQTALIEAHLDEGNLFEAIRQYRAYCRLLDEEFEAVPGEQLTSLITDASRPRRLHDLSSVRDSPAPR